MVNCKVTRTGGPRSCSESARHINELELLAGFNALKLRSDRLNYWNLYGQYHSSVICKLTWGYRVQPVHSLYLLFLWKGDFKLVWKTWNKFNRVSYKRYIECDCRPIIEEIFRSGRLATLSQSIRDVCWSLKNNNRPGPDGIVVVPLVRNNGLRVPSIRVNLPMPEPSIDRPNGTRHGLPVLNEPCLFSSDIETSAWCRGDPSTNPGSAKVSTRRAEPVDEQSINSPSCLEIIRYPYHMQK